MDSNKLKSRLFEEAIKMVLWKYHKKEIEEFNSITGSMKINFQSKFRYFSETYKKTMNAPAK